MIQQKLKSSTNWTAARASAKSTQLAGKSVLK
jgi:hypothetical protein